VSFETLEKITNSLISEYPESNAWAGSPFDWIRHLPSGSKGVIGRHIASGLLQSYGFTPTASKSHLRVNGQVILVRTAMMWQQGIIKFQNLRDSNFQHAICLGLYPRKAFAWLVPKDEIWLNGRVRKDRIGIKSQHKGADAWVQVDPENLPPWLTAYGGTSDEFVQVAERAL